MRVLALIGITLATLSAGPTASAAPTLALRELPLSNLDALVARGVHRDHTSGQNSVDGYGYFPLDHSSLVKDGSNFSYDGLEAVHEHPAAYHPTKRAHFAKRDWKSGLKKFFKNIPYIVGFVLHVITHPKQSWKAFTKGVV